MYNMKQYKTMYYTHHDFFGDKDQKRLDYILNEMSKLGFHLINTLNHGPCYNEGKEEVIILFFERDVPDKE